MAEVFVIASNGMKVNKVIALACQPDFTDIVRGRYEIAKGIHAAHRNTGDSYITMERSEDGFSDLDWQVTLNDERGQWAAMSIENGRRRYRIGPRTVGIPEHGKDIRGRTVGPMEGIRPLGIAFDIPDTEVF